MLPCTATDWDFLLPPFLCSATIAGSSASDFRTSPSPSLSLAISFGLWFGFFASHPRPGNLTLPGFSVDQLISTTVQFHESCSF
ncbi:uncharacterized protein BO96DRAFT_414637 [Aspergillus niger CBS 101883]|uniref:uncharacterized protein n=1 Tax=Aspergillus lacticoffeatus (strain CBS 101883) TaxID=1450533 RepID=UPI000D7FEF2D|nr:uncharacterized protein BO96DRAFT_414637 [Aspergillus niger CBS 101883]PYH53590.1 hypothetical protein BO96DRAFT_414637 [Aspergillus niger CBS 101883]